MGPRSRHEPFTLWHWGSGRACRALAPPDYHTAAFCRMQGGGVNVSQERIQRQASSTLTRRWLLRSIGLGVIPAWAIAACAGASPVAVSPTPGTATAGTTPAPTRRFAGTTLRIATVSFVYSAALNKLAPEFESRTGIKFEIEQAGFPVTLERVNLELSTGGGSYDVLQMIFAIAGKIVGAGWATDLMPFIERDKAEVELDDFPKGALAAFRKDGSLYALPWLADTTMAAYRKDLLESAGYSTFPKTFDELLEAAAKTHSPETAFFVTQNLWNWHWPNWLQGFGGDFFRDPPGDLYPTFDTDAAVQSADMMGRLVREYGPAGGANYSNAEAIAAVQQGRAAVYIDGLGNLQATLNKEASRVADKMSFAAAPRGAAGWFPQMSSHGFLIPSGAKNKEAAWEFMKWSTSKETMLKIALQENYNAATRISVLTNPEFKEKYKVAGVDVAQLHLDVQERAGEGYMAYRVVPVFSAIGSRVNVALSEVIAKRPAKEAMAALQKDAFDILEKAGVKVQR